MMENQIGQWVIIGIVVAFVAFEKAKKFFGKSNNPGYGERTGRLEERMKDVERRLGNIERKLNGMK